MNRLTSRHGRQVRRAWVALWIFGITPLVAEEWSRPGIIDLAGSWSLWIDGERAGGDDVEPGAVDGAGLTVVLPVEQSSLAATAGGTFVLRRELDLGADWRQRLAPSGLAILISGSSFGQFRLSAGDEVIGQWRESLTAPVKPGHRFFEVPAAAVDSAGRVLLSVAWQHHSWRASWPFGERGAIGSGWLLGDAQRLETEAELRQLKNLNSDLPLLILALIYAAIGAYHLQLFRRDSRYGEYLWFGATAIAVALYTLLLSHWAAVLSEGYPRLHRLHVAVGAVVTAISIQFLWPFLGRPIGPWLRRYQLSSLVMAALVMVLPVGLWTPVTAAICRAWGIPFMIAAGMALAVGLRRHNAEARALAIGGFAIVVVGVIAVISQVLGKGSVFPLQAYAFAIFAVSMAFSLSNRFSRVHDDLDILRLQLEDMVEDRAGELSTANQRLRSEISERELAQEAMRMLERAVEQSIDGILVADLEESTLFANEAWGRLHGLETFEIFGRRLDLFHDAEQLGQMRPVLERVKREGSWEGEIDHLGKGGSVFPTWMSITLLRDPVAEPVGFVMVARDISMRRQAAAEKQRIETRIQEAEKLRSLADLAGGIAHDYNNLLTGVLGNSSLALQELPSGSQAREKLAQIGSAAERAAELTAQLLAYAGTETLVLKRMDLDQLVLESRSELSRAAGDRARLEIELGKGLPKIEADATQVRQAIENLVVNAAAATPAASEEVIRLETGKINADRDYLVGGYLDGDHPPGEYVFLKVSDRGGGIDLDQERIFDPFATHQGGMRGLGMATVLSTIRVHRGTVKVSNRPEGGTTFELLFPAAGEKTGEARPTIRPSASWRGSGTVLVVDDEYIMREVSRSILEQTGFEVLATGEGLEALELYRRHMSEIRLVLLDRTMPSMPGEEVLARILALNCDARVVLMSGYRSDSTVRELTDKGMAEFLPKPFRPEELLEKVRRVIG